MKRMNESPISVEIDTKIAGPLGEDVRETSEVHGTNDQARAVSSMLYTSGGLTFSPAGLPPPVFGPSHYTDPVWGVKDNTPLKRGRSVRRGRRGRDRVIFMVLNLIHQRPYQKLVVWEEAHMLCLWAYKCTEKFPQKELYRLVDQMCRSSSSIPTNIAEGSAKSSKKERARYYEISQGSLEEFHYQCVLSKDLGYITDAEFSKVDDMIQRTSYLLVKLKTSCR